MAIATDIQQQVFDLLSRSSGVSFVSTDQETIGRIALVPGQRVTAEVIGSMPNNRTQVRVGSERFNLELPTPVRPGQSLEMTFITLDPRATFAIARQGGATHPVSLSDASRLLSMLISSEQIQDPGLRSSLQNIGDMLRRSPGEAGVLANLLDEALTYGSVQKSVKDTAPPPGNTTQQSGGGQTPGQQGSRQISADQARLAAFESNAAQILRNIARNSRFILIEALNPTQSPMPLFPGEEVNAVVTGTLPGGRTFVQVAGTPLEMTLPRQAATGDILRLTYISSSPKPTFAIPRALHETSSGALSEAGRWLSVLEHVEGGISSQQLHVLERLNTVLKSLPPDSPAFSAIHDQAIVYRGVPQARTTADQTSSETLRPSPQPSLMPGNGIVLNHDMARLLQAVIRGNRLSLLESLNQPTAQTGFTPGQQLKGEVLSALGGGRFSVQVQDLVFEFAMPKGVRRGDSINLFFITNDPQNTFLMARFTRSGAAVVSETGRWLSSFLGAASNQLHASETINALRTLLPAPPTNPSQLGQALQQGLRESGLFYESHLARWFGGEYRLDDILKEPQGRLSPRLPNAPERQVPVPVGELALATMKTGSSEVMEAVLQKAGTSMLHEGIADPRTHPVVNEQLTTLQNGQHVFRGDLFPGQPMKWTVAERDSRRNSAGERERTWETRVDIILPRLGAVNVRLVLDGSNINLDFNAGTKDTALTLETGKQKLAEQLEAAGLTPSGFTISHAQT